MPALAQPTAELWNTIFNVVLVFGAIFVLAGTWGAFWTGNMKEFYSNARISANEATTATANATAEVAKADAARAHERASEADLARAKLEARLAPRRLNEEQKRLLKKALDSEKPYERIDVISEGNPEATYYASQFVDYFRSAGLKSDLLSELYVGGPTSAGPFHVRNDPSGFIRRMLTRAGFDHDGEADYEGIAPCFIVSPRAVEE